MVNRMMQLVPVFIDDRQARRDGEVPSGSLAHVHERSDDAHVASVDLVVRLHRPDLAVVQRTHEEGLGEVVEMLREHQLVVAVGSAARVQQAALEP